MGQLDVLAARFNGDGPPGSGNKNVLTGLPTNKSYVITRIINHPLNHNQLPDAISEWLPSRGVNN